MKSELREAVLQILKEEFGIYKDEDGTINIADKNVMIQRITDYSFDSPISIPKRKGYRSYNIDAASGVLSFDTLQKAIDTAKNSPIEPQMLWYSQLSKPEELPKTKVIPKTNLKQPGKYWIEWTGDGLDIIAYEDSCHIGDKTGPNWIEIQSPCYFVGTSVYDLTVIPEGSSGPLKMYSTNVKKQAFIKETQDKMKELYTKIQKDIAIFGTGYTKIYVDDPIPNICSHSWKSYQGFSESYDYCEKCDLKK